mmetsp:Transcript_1577/g.3054  ORF Transcript_1577/g.3054 Transcript_1577/m.3054 type:complete len:239 (-) Transcript_1577:102-818(-)
MFRRADNQRGTRGGHLVQSGEAFDPESSRWQPGIVGGEISRYSVIERERVDGDRACPRLEQHLRRLGVETRIMLRGAIKSPERIAADLGGPARMHRDTGAVRDIAIGVDPRRDVVGRHTCIRVAFGTRRDIDHAERCHEVGDRDLVNRRAIGAEMQWRIDMGSGVLIHREVEEVEAIIGKVEQLLARELALAEVGREILAQRMGHVVKCPVPLRHRRRRRAECRCRGPCGDGSAALEE